jgi:hypothetical protein
VGNSRILVFEVRLPTGLDGTPPHLDFVARGTSFVAIESKATEHLQAHEAHFASSYATVRWPSTIQPYVEIMKDLVQNPRLYTYLDAAQLVKHACGLSRCTQVKDVILLYLFWEPTNCLEFDVFQQHRAEAEDFAHRTAHAMVQFRWMSYLDLWRDWISTHDVDIRAHGERVIERYAFAI